VLLLSNCLSFKKSLAKYFHVLKIQILDIDLKFNFRIIFGIKDCFEV